MSRIPVALMAAASLLAAPGCATPGGTEGPHDATVIIEVDNTGASARRRRVSLIPIGGEPIRLGTVAAGGSAVWRLDTERPGRYVLRAAPVDPSGSPGASVGVLSNRFLIEEGTEHVVWALGRNHVEIEDGQP